jgi:hypothetical protein
MDAHRFDQLTRIATHAASRRGLLNSGVASLAGLIALRGLGSGSTAARVRGKTHRGKGNGPQPNAFGCDSVGKSCRGKDSKCCSGICQGKKPKRGEPDRTRCVAHDASTCLKGQYSKLCTPGATDIKCTTSGGVKGLCTTTTGNAPYCFAESQGACAPCHRDTDCEAFCGAGAACMQCFVGCPTTGGTACVGLTSCTF